MENFKRKALISLISSYASQFATTATNLATKLILAHLIAPGDLGVYAKALFVQLGLEMLMDMGVTQHVARENHRPYGAYLVIRVAAALILIAAVQIFGGVFSVWGAELPNVSRALSIILLIKALSGVPNLYLERELMIQKSVLPQLLRLFTNGVVSIILARLNFGVWALVCGAVTGEFTFAVFMWRSAWAYIPIDITWRHGGTLIWESRHLFAISLMGFALQQGDIAITGSLLPNKQVGFYAMAYSLVIILSKVVEAAVYRVIYPLFCEYRDNISDLGNIYRRATLAVYAVEAPIYMFLIFNARVIIPALLGEKWRPAVPIIQLLSIYGIINPLPTFGNEILRAKKQDRLLTLSNVIGSVTLIVSGYLLTKSHGAEGMAIAKYIVIGSIPVVMSLYSSIRQDLILLVGQLALVYSIAVVGIGIVSLGFSFSAAAQVAAGTLFIPLIWIIYYYMFGSEIGTGALRNLRADTVRVTEAD